MKVISLTTTNYKNARRVEIQPDPDGNLVFIAGNNGAGKSSVLDSIAAALGGANSKTTPKPIRNGADRAEIVLETDELTVTRVFTGSGSRLTVKSADGGKHGQAKLDELVGKLSMDPFAFTQLDEKKQLAQLLDLVDLPFNPEQLESERAAVFADRTQVNRSVKEYEEQLKAYGEVPEGLPAAEVSVSELLTEYRNHEVAQQERDRYLTDLNESQYKVQELERQLAAAREHLANVTEVVGHVSDHTADLESLRVRIDSAEETNRAVRKAQERGRLAFQLEAVKEESADLTEKLEAIAQRKAEGLAAAKFPVDGLGFDEAGVTYQGVPFKQASTAEQIRVSMAMAIALNPKLRVIRITDGSLLDANSMSLVEHMAREHDYQVWLEIVGDGPDGAYTIVDGELAS